MRTMHPKNLPPLMAATAAVMLLLTGSLRAEVTDFPPQGRQPYENERTSTAPPAGTPGGAPATMRKKGDSPTGNRGAETTGEPGPNVLGDEYWRAAFEYCRSHGGRMIDGNRLCIM